jgi:hypothetical protein
VGGGLLNMATGGSAAIGGGMSNQVSGSRATVAGGESNLASGTQAAVGGGERNSAGGSRATVGGGEANGAGGDWAAISGGRLNQASQLFAAVGGGHRNAADAMSATVSGGQFNQASGLLATVGGGGGDLANPGSGDNEVSGGNLASGERSTVGGGGGDDTFDTAGNTASGIASTVAGGEANAASGNHSVVAGGLMNTASNIGATVGGGEANMASGFYATVPGGESNTAAGDHSFAAGENATADTNAHNSFVWSDGTPITETNAQVFRVEASSGIYFTDGGVGTLPAAEVGDFPVFMNPTTGQLVQGTAGGSDASETNELVTAVSFNTTMGTGGSGGRIGGNLLSITENGSGTPNVWEIDLSEFISQVTLSGGATLNGSTLTVGDGLGNGSLDMNGGSLTDSSAGSISVMSPLALNSNSIAGVNDVSAVTGMFSGAVSALSYTGDGSGLTGVGDITEVIAGNGLTVDTNTGAVALEAVAVDGTGSTAVNNADSFSFNVVFSESGMMLNGMNDVAARSDHAHSNLVRPDGASSVVTVDDSNATTLAGDLIVMGNVGSNLNMNGNYSLMNAISVSTDYLTVNAQVSSDLDLGSNSLSADSVSVTSVSAGSISTNNATIEGTLDLMGSGALENAAGISTDNLTIAGSLTDSLMSIGTSGQALVSTGSAVEWQNLPGAIASTAFNGMAGTSNRGTPGNVLEITEGSTTHSIDLSNFTAPVMLTSVTTSGAVRFSNLSDAPADARPMRVVVLDPTDNQLYLGQTVSFGGGRPAPAESGFVAQSVAPISLNQSGEIKRLRDENKELRAENAALEARLARLEALVLGEASPAEKN